MTLSLRIFGILLVSLTGVRGLWDFPENFVVAKRNNTTPVTLTCGTKIDGPVTWKFDGEVIEDFDDYIQPDGQNLKVSGVDAPLLGEYSCWSGGEMLLSTYLLLEAEEEGESESLINCWAKSYDCNFNCKWTNSRYTAVRLGLDNECAKGGKLCHWVRSSDGGFQFELSHSLSPYAEETTMIELTAEAIVSLFVFRITTSFYLRDIVQPDSPQIVMCQEMDQNLNVTIKPPSSWSSPHSFFSLEHEIEYVFKDDGKVGRSSSSLIPKSVSKLRVRSRDSVVLSTWSQWTPWKNLRTKANNLCKCRNTAKYCCPELPSGYLDQCQKKRKKSAKSSQTS
ncbi:interleukin-12 subunit beta isoform X1 [Scophthalmus maximus]|uniref:interleukin-12 subunit beta isoform X1 n=1 Tax=Scophthalmus maximus TaxID=52904 RepID=UPI0015E0E040|nr:interleukin-12 subunit beta isoform X1 [Scophthalmus maximus]